VSLSSGDEMELEVLSGGNFWICFLREQLEGDSCSFFVHFLYSAAQTKNAAILDYGKKGTHW
jgi:hypothetical protein